MRYGIEVRDGAVIVIGRGIPLFRGQGDAEFRALVHGLLGSGVQRLVIDDSAARRLAPGMALEMQDWRRRLEENGGRLAVVRRDGISAPEGLAGPALSLRMPMTLDAAVRWVTGAVGMRPTVARAA